ncbi:MAG: Uma2 family endonuclease [Cyanobacteria bacterium P01_F01_bin.13]
MDTTPQYISPDDYLALESQHLVRHEYQGGLVHAMAIAADNHGRIAFNFLKIIDDHLGDVSECRFYGGNIKVGHLDEFYYYPDALLTCDLRDRKDRYVKRYPELIAEIFSPATEAFDRDEKFRHYQRLDSLEEYVLISQESPLVECWRRSVNGGWESRFYEGDDLAILMCIGLEFAVADLYRGIDAT